MATSVVSSVLASLSIRQGSLKLGLSLRHSPEVQLFQSSELEAETLRQSLVSTVLEQWPTPAHGNKIRGMIVLGLTETHYTVSLRNVPQLQNV